MRTLDVTRLSNEDLCRLCAIEQLNWGVLNEPVIWLLLALQQEVEEQRKEIVELTNLLKHTVLHPEKANASEIIKRIFPESKQFPPSVKKRKLLLKSGKESDICTTSRTGSLGPQRGNTAGTYTTATSQGNSVN
jgi:hypothetical protein